MATKSATPPGVHRDASSREIRRPDRTDAILVATYELLTEVGYDRLTIDAVAARARASKATIYNRWPGKRELAIEAFSGAGDAPLRHEPTGRNLAADLRSFVEATRQVSGDADARAFLSLLAAGQRDPVIADALRATLAEPRYSCRLIIDRAIQRGELRSSDPDHSAERVLQLIMGQAIVHNLVLGTPMDDAFVRDLVDTVLIVLLRDAADHDQG